MTDEYKPFRDERGKSDTGNFTDERGMTDADTGDHLVNLGAEYDKEHKKVPGKGLDSLKAFAIILGLFLTFLILGGLLFMKFFARKSHLITTGNGNIVTQKRDVPAFTSISASGAIELEITAGEAQSVEVIADENIQPMIITEVNGGELQIVPSGSFNSSRVLRVKITAPNIEGITLAGSAEATARNIKNDKLRIDVSGSGEINLQGQTKDLDTTISGSGSVNAADFSADKARVGITGSGNAVMAVNDELNATISGSGNLKSLKSRVKKAVISITGSGDAEVNVADELDINIAGSGEVMYAGGPKVTQMVTGSGSVRKRD